MWKVVDHGDVTRQKVEILEVRKQTGEEWGDFLYRVFHSYPPEYEVQVQGYIALIIKRTKADVEKRPDTTKKR